MLATDGWMVLFRLLHILAGVFWVGSVFLFVFFVQPGAAAIAPAGAPFMAELLGKRRFVDRMIALGLTTIAAGLVMYWIDWHDFPSFGDWFDTTFGLALTIGGLCAIAALTVGVLVTRPGVQRMLALGRQAAEAGGPPSPEIAAQIGALQQRLKVAGRISFALLVVAVMLMASGRYL
jgi:uncharacterized membrane protein